MPTKGVSASILHLAGVVSQARGDSVTWLLGHTPTLHPKIERPARRCLNPQTIPNPKPLQVADFSFRIPFTPLGTAGSQ